jgi:hypothetical protein
MLAVDAAVGVLQVVTQLVLPTLAYSLCLPLFQMMYPARSRIQWSDEYPKACRLNNEL